MAARRHGDLRGDPGPLQADRADAPVWLTLTDLGRLYGISAMHCGRLLSQAGLRDADGHPTDRALRSGCAAPPQQRHGGQPCWHRQQCGDAFAAAGLETVRRLTLVQQWADLLSAMAVGSPAISTSAAQMAEEMPEELLEPVNRQLRRLGSSFQVQRSGCGLSRGGGATSAARREPLPAATAAAAAVTPAARAGRRPRVHGASG